MSDELLEVVEDRGSDPDESRAATSDDSVVESNLDSTPNKIALLFAAS